MNKVNWGNAALSVAIALAMLVGFNALILQPQIAELQVEARGSGVTRFNTNVRFENPVTFEDTTDLQGAVDLDGAITANGALDVDGAATLNSTLDVDGIITSGTGAVTVTDALQVNGNATLTGTLTLEGVDFTGPVVGVSGTISDNVKLAHGLGTTPT